MVARVQSHHKLVVTFVRDGEEPESRYAADGKQAWASAIGLIAKHDALRHGDTLIVVNADE
jgi:hypothetical protein